MSIDFDISEAIDYNHRTGAGPDERRIAQAIAAWQAAHGLDSDGKLGPKTRASLDDAAAAAPPPAPSRPVDYARVAAEAVTPARQVVVDLAIAATAERVYYDLGAGGSTKHPAWPPWDAQHKCDCSALVCGALGFHRGEDGGWNTAKMVADAVRFDRQTRTAGGAGPGKRFEYLGMIKIPAGAAIDRATIPSIASGVLGVLSRIRPGDVIVHDGRYDPKTGVRLVPGHTGIVVGVDLERFDPAFPDLWFECVSIVHCSPHNSTAAGEPGHAIARTDAAAFKHEAMFLSYKPLAG